MNKYTVSNISCSREWGGCEPVRAPVRGGEEQREGAGTGGLGAAATNLQQGTHWYRHLLVVNLYLLHLLSCAVFEFHKLVDEQLEQEREQRLGTTKRGIGPAYAAKV